MRMKLTSKILAVFLLITLTAGCFAGCQNGNDPTKTSSTSAEPAPFVDYVSQVKLNMDSATAKMEVTVHQFVDGDTTHFNVPNSFSADGIMKIRYIAVNTPESTGSIEPWGKKASNFTKDKLSNAESIVIESNGTDWEKDSSGGRYMGWVWYKNKGESEYRNLNLELVQEGLSLACGATTDLYGSYTGNAYIQAQNNKLYVFSEEKDPDFYDGDAIPVDIKTLRSNIELFANKKVVFTGVIVRNNSNTVYVESYDEESELYYGISVYYGFNNAAAMKVLSVGNEVEFVGSVQYYEAGGTWQVTDISYNPMASDKTDQIKLVSTGHATANTVTDPAKFTTGKVTLNVLKELGGEETEEKVFDYAQLVMSTSIAMNNLYVKDVYTTSNGGDNDGAMTLTCEVDGITITVRTTVLRKADKTLYSKEDFIGKTIDVTGIVDFYSGEYQIKVFSAKNITVHE